MTKVEYSKIGGDSVKIAHLILAHTDPKHIVRLSKKLADFSDVYIHVDANANIEEYQKSLQNYENIYFLGNRVHCGWETWNAVQATLNLMRVAMSNEKYDRLTFLQGLDYPLKSPNQITEFYNKNENIEFIRACCISFSKDYYMSQKCCQYWFRNHSNKLQDYFSKLEKRTKWKFRSGIIFDDQKYKVYWGSAQWSLTGKCADYILEFHDNHPKFNKWFYYSFPVDELYFATIVHNSKFSDYTLAGGSEPEKEKLVNWRNLHYFEYPDQIRIYEKKDYDYLTNLSELYVRKTTTKQSTELLDMIDKYHKLTDR